MAPCLVEAGPGLSARHRVRYAAPVNAGTSKPEKFVWPPKRLPEAEMGLSADPSSWAGGEDGGPVVRASAPSTGLRLPVPAEPAAVVAARELSWWRTFETVWLGLVRPTLAERVLDEGWRPDGPSAFCPRCA